MFRSPGSICFLLLTLAACNTGRHSSAGFRLPPDADATRGQAAFLAHRCNDCHEVSGVNLPRPNSPHTVTVFLGGEVAREKSDGYLVTSIINPSYAGTRSGKEGQHRMPEYAGELTVRELADMVEFLQAHYSVRRYPAQPVYY